MALQGQDTNRDPCFARAVSAELRKMYPDLTTKYVACDLECTPQAAKNLLNGHMSSTTVAKLISAYGPGWVAERVLEAAGSSLEQHIEKQVEEAERLATAAQERAREARQRLERYQASRRLLGDVDRKGPDPRL